MSEITIEEIRNMVDELVMEPKVDELSGKVDIGWVSLNKLRVETYLKLLGGESDNKKLEIEI